MTQFCVNDCGRPANSDQIVCCLPCKSGAHFAECDIASLPPDAVWRTGRKNDRVLYAQRGAEPSDADPMVGSMLTPELAAQVVRGRRKAAAYEQITGSAEPWPLKDVLHRLAEFADLKLRDGYDGHGHEELSECVRRAGQILAEIDKEMA